MDTLLVETILSDPSLYKKAGLVSDVLSRVKEYFSRHIDKAHPVKSVIDNLAPGAVWLLFSRIGLGRWGTFLGILMDYFHVDVSGILQSLWEKLKGVLSGGGKVSSAQIDSAVESTTQEFAGSPEASQADDHNTYSSLNLFDQARVIKLAMVDYEHQQMRLFKDAAGRRSPYSFTGKKPATVSLLSTVFGWIIKAALVSAGLMVAGDIAHEVLGGPSALSGTYQAGETPKEQPGPALPTGPKSTQTKFPLKGDSSLPEAWPQVNTPANIENMIIEFAKDTYSGLDGKEDLIRNSPAFQAVNDDIAWFNIHNPGSALIFLPKHYPSKKALVDYFIDDVAKRAG